MEEKITSKILFSGLLKKYKNTQTAVLGEVTMEDEIASRLYRGWNALQNVNYKNWYDKKGLSYDLDIPADYVPYDPPVRRIDALIFEGNQRTAIEIKISRADFFRDTLEKRAPWMRHTDRFIYLTPTGLVKPEEVPEQCGLWEYNSTLKTIRSTKRSKVNKNVQDFPASMIKYFAWRAYNAEKVIGRHR